MSPIFCAARRRRTMRPMARSPSRPARPTAIATPLRSASTRRIRSASGWAGPTMPPSRASSAGLRRRRFSSMRFRASAALMKIRRSRRAFLLVTNNADLPPPLRNLRLDIAKTSDATDTAALKIVYPPAGAAIDLGIDGCEECGECARLESARRRAAFHLDGERRAHRRAGSAPAIELDARWRGLRAGLGDRCQRRVRQRRRAAGIDALFFSV